MSMPLPKNHWIYGDGNFNVPPMPFKMGGGWRASVLIQDPSSQQFAGMVQRTGMTREDFAERIRDAGRYAVKCATMNGTEMDFDPDAMIQNLVVGMLGYWTENGLTDDEWANPAHGGGAGWTAPPKPPVSPLEANQAQTTRPSYPNKFWADPEHRTPEYRESLEIQIRLWMNGVWQHNAFSNECTPDLGCCAENCRELDEQRRYDQGTKFLEKISQ